MAESNFEIISRGLEEFQDSEQIRRMLTSGKIVRCLWATAPTGRPHIGYLAPFIKIVDFLRAGVEVIVWIGDYYAYAVNFVHSLEKVRRRARYYELIMTEAFKMLGAPTSKLRFVRESSYETDPSFYVDLLRLNTLTSRADITAVGEEYGSGTMFSPSLCPGLQALAEEYLDIDFQFGGIDQRGHYAFSADLMTKMGYRKRAYAMNAMVPGMTCEKMSASVPGSKLNFLDDPDIIRSKIWAASCRERDTVSNPLLSLVEIVLFPVGDLRASQQIDGTDAHAKSRIFACVDGPAGTMISIPMSDPRSGSWKHFSSFTPFRDEYAVGAITSDQVRELVATALTELLEPMRTSCERNHELWEVDLDAYAASDGDG